MGAPLTVPGVSGLVGPQGQGGCGYEVPACESTMDLAWNLYKSGRFPPFAWVRADSQTRGRGRKGRLWVSGPGSLTATLRLPDAANELGDLLSMAAALVLVRALTTLGVVARIKWPNDILTGLCKTGGILIEERQGIIMAGIGMNLCDSPENSRMETFFRMPAGCLNQCGVEVSASRLWYLFWDSFRQQFPAMIADPVSVAAQVDTCLAWKNEIMVLEDTGKYDGPARILGVDGRGRLKIRTGQGDFRICSGTVHPRVI